MSRSASRSGSYRRRSHSRGRSERGRSDSPMRTKRDVEATVSRIDDQRGFGFLEIDGERDEVFFHSNDVEDGVDIRQLRKGDLCTVDLEPSKKKHGRYDGKNIRPPSEARDRSETGRRPRRSRSRSRGRRRSYSPRRRSYSPRRRSYSPRGR